MNFTAALGISNFGELRASFQRLRSLVSELTDKSVHFGLDFLHENPISMMKIH